MNLQWQARRDSNPQPPDLESGALPFELLAYLFGFLMGSVRLAKRTIFFQFQLMWNSFFIFCRRVIALLTILASQRNGISHNLTYRVKAAGCKPGCKFDHIIPTRKSGEVWITR